MGIIVSCVSNIMYISEKLTLAMTCVGLIICIVITFIVTLGMGIGLGYNYCFVELKTKLRHVPGHYAHAGDPRWPYLRVNTEMPEYQDPLENSSDEVLRELPGIPEEMSNTYVPEIGNVPVGKIDEKPLKSNFYFKTEVGDKKRLQEIVALNSNVTEKSDEFDSVNEENVTTTAVVDSSTAYSVIVNSTKAVSNDSFAKEVAYRKVDFHEDFPEPPVVDINVGSADQSGGKRVKKVIIPISGLDLITLLSKVKAENKNYSLQIVTT